MQVMVDIQAGQARALHRIALCGALHIASGGCLTLQRCFAYNCAVLQVSMSCGSGAVQAWEAFMCSVVPHVKDVARYLVDMLGFVHRS